MIRGLFTKRWLHFSLLFGLLFTFVFVVPADSPLRQRIQFLTFDYYLTTYKRVPQESAIIVDIDDVSLTKVAQWPWPRTIVADIVENLTKMDVSVIAFDGVLAEPDRTSPVLWPKYADTPELKNALRSVVTPLTDNDLILAKSIEQSGKFVTGFSFGSNNEPPVLHSLTMAQPVKKIFLRHTHNFRQTARFLPVLEKAAAGNGSFMANAEVDGVIRKTALVFSNGEELYPSLVVEALRVRNRDGFSPKISPNKNFSGNSIDTEYRLIIGNYNVPIEKDGKMWVHYRDFDKKIDYVPAWKVFDPAYFDEIKERVNGKIVLVGSSAEGLLDLRSTPLGLLPGVEVHANALEQILNDNYLIRPKIVKEAESNFILMIGLLLIILAPFIGASWLAFICFTLSGGIFYLSYLSFVQYGVLVDPIYPVIAALLLYMLSSVLTYIRTEAERKQVREAFGLYISPDFMEELTKDPDKLKLGGETRELSVMFTDIRSFTSISETMSPEALIQLMNDFLTPMSNLVMENRGTIDKYMGDAMMAFWNAPLDDSHHARHACRTALLMNKALEPINDELIKKANEEKRTPLILEAGIGINTGQASVGNMGSKQRFAYSALGDTVNLASRLEGQTKQYGVRVLIGENTRLQVPEFAMLELDLIRVKGKREPERIFVLLGDEKMQQSDYFKDWEEKHNEMLVAYRAREWDKARKLADACQNVSEEGMTMFYYMFIDRLAEMKKKPPPPEWDGVFVAKTK